MAKPVPLPPPGFDELSVDEQIEYVQSLWERIAATPEQWRFPNGTVKSWTNARRTTTPIPTPERAGTSSEIGFAINCVSRSHADDAPVDCPALGAGRS